MYRRWVVPLIVFLLLASVATAAAQSRSVFWDRWDVVIDQIDTAANRFRVTEQYAVKFSGSFRFGSAVIPNVNLERIRDIQLAQNGQLLTQTSRCTEQPGTFCVETSAAETAITYYFLRTITDGSAEFTIRYIVEGALRVYEGGDQLWWIAVPSEHFGFTINSSTIRVEMPEGFAPREGVDPVETYGVPGQVSVSGRTVIAQAQRPITGNESFEIRVQYPHDPNARIAEWQANFDRQRAFDETVRPLLDLGGLVVSVLIAIAGVFLVFNRWRTRGRDPEIGPVPAYLTEPPSDLPPAVVGTLIDEQADVRDVISTLVDMARRGYLVIEESQEPGFMGIGLKREFTFKRTDQRLEGLRRFEQRMMNNLFSGGQMQRSLESLRNNFYRVIAQMQSDLYQEMVDEGLFTGKPNDTRNTWTGFGILLVTLAGFGVFGAASLAMDVSVALFCLPAALGVVGVAVIAAGQSMPARTQKGAEENAKWRAFLEYLRNLEQYTQVESAVGLLDQYLPYAIAFGIDKSWLRKFSGVQAAPLPPWYWPTYYGPYRRGYIPGTPLNRAPMANGGGMGELARADDGGFSLDDVSSGMSSGLESLSTGLSSMLDSASRVLTSQPQQSGGSGRWSGGGRGWSGGGGFGGGGSGGGSRGFG